MIRKILIKRSPKILKRILLGSFLFRTKKMNEISYFLDTLKILQEEEKRTLFNNFSKNLSAARQVTILKMVYSKHITHGIDLSLVREFKNINPPLLKKTDGVEALYYPLIEMIESEDRKGISFLLSNLSVQEIKTCLSHYQNDYQYNQINLNYQRADKLENNRVYMEILHYIHKNSN